MSIFNRAARRLEEENTRLRREVADLQDINRKLAAKLAVDNARARDEVTSLEEQFTALADQLDAHAKECIIVGEGPAWDTARVASMRIRRILEGTKIHEGDP